MYTILFIIIVFILYLASLSFKKSVKLEPRYKDIESLTIAYNDI